MGGFTKAYKTALKRMSDTDMIATEESAGFAVLDDGRYVQVFVRLYEYDDDLLESKPLTGGLVANK